MKFSPLTCIIVYLFPFVGGICCADLTETKMRQEIFEAVQKYFVQEIDNMKQKYDSRITMLTEQFATSKRQLLQMMSKKYEKYQDEIRIRQKVYTEEMRELKLELASVRKENKYEMLMVKEELAVAKQICQGEITDLKQKCNAVNCKFNFKGEFDKHNSPNEKLSVSHEEHSGSDEKHSDSEETLSVSDETHSGSEEKHSGSNENHSVSKEKHSGCLIGGRIKSIVQNHLNGNARNENGDDSDKVEKYPAEYNAILHTGQKRQVTSPGGSRVAFFASLTSNATHMTPNQDIIFDNVTLNLGNAYMDRHGVFIAPVPGVYVFSVTLLDTGNKSHAFVEKNGNMLAVLHNELWKQSSQTVITELHKGDDVAIKVVHHTDVGYFGAKFCTFSGFLLYDYSDTVELIGK